MVPNDEHQQGGMLRATRVLHPTPAATQGWGAPRGAHAANLPCKFLLPGVSDPHPSHLPRHGGGSKPARASPAPALGQFGYFGFSNLMGAGEGAWGWGGGKVGFILSLSSVSPLPLAKASLLHLMTAAPIRDLPGGECAAWPPPAHPGCRGLGPAIVPPLPLSCFLTAGLGSTRRESPELPLGRENL